MATEAEWISTIDQTKSEYDSGIKTESRARKVFETMRSGLIGDPDPTLTPAAKSRVVDRIEDHLDAMDAANKTLKESEVAAFSFEELIAELRRLRVDPKKGNYAGGVDEGYRADLINEFIKKADAWKWGNSPEECLRLLSLKVQYLLERFAGTTDTGSGAATVPRENMMSTLPAYMLTREEVMLATTQHPLWGRQTRKILDDVIEKAAGETKKLTDGNKFSYATLASARGLNYLSEFIDTEYSGDLKEARDFAKLLFQSFDMLSIVLQVRQRTATGTRSHNAGESFEPIASQDMAAAAIQNGLRYGGNKADWRKWSFTWFKEFPGTGMYGGKMRIADGTPHGTEVDLTAEMNEQRELVLAYWNCFIDADKLIKPLQANLKTDAQSYFPDTRDLLKLGDTPTSGATLTDRSELIMYPTGVDATTGLPLAAKGKIIDMNDAEILDDKPPAPPANWAEYDVAMSGWTNMIKMSYQHPGDHLSAHQILAEVDGQKGGLLNKFLSEAGKAKIFQPKHLREFLPVMLFTFILRLIQFSAVNIEDRPHLRDEIVEALESSGGLTGGFSHEIHDVIEKLKDPEVVAGGWKTRRKQVERYVALYCKFYNIKNPGGYGTFWEKLKPEQESIRDVLKAAAGPPYPFRTDGDLLTKKS